MTSIHIFSVIVVVVFAVVCWLEPEKVLAAMTRFAIWRGL